MNEVFGEEHFVAQFVWKARQFTDARATTNVSTDHEYIMAYARTLEFSLRGTERDESKFSNPDGDPRGLWMSRSILGLATREQRPNLHYDLVEPIRGRVFPPNPATGWRYSPEKMAELVADGRILFPSKNDGRPREKKFRQDMQSEYIAFRSIIDGVHTADGTQEVRDLLGGEVFSFPKPAALVEALVEQVLEEGGLVLDFFAGSGTTAHAVLDLNKQNDGDRKFILVQLPEPTGREDYPTIADITKERVRRVIKKLNDEYEGKLDPGFGKVQDRGFRVFKLAESNFKPWNANVPANAAALESQLELHVDHVRKDRTDQDLLFEILLKSGHSLATKTEALQLGDKKVWSVAGGALLVCLERELTVEVIRAMVAMKPERVVCLDEGFAGNDQLKANAVQIFKSTDSVFKTV